jgi:hypothetical protein
MEHKRWDEAYIVLHQGALAVGVTSIAGEREREQEREKERVRPRGEPSEAAYTASLLLWLPPLISVVRPCVRTLHVRLFLSSPPFLGALDIPFIDARRCPAVQWGCSLELTWLAGKCPEPCIDNNVAVGGAP